MRKTRVGILISGRGSNMRALVDAAAAPDYPAEIALIISNKADAAGLSFAAANGIARHVIDHKDYDSRESFDDAVDRALGAAGIELVCLAGFMRILSKSFVDRWRDRLLNIHPSLLPAFKGLHIHERVLQAGVRITGCTVHYVRAEMDEGPVIAQAAVPVSTDDTEDSLAGPCPGRRTPALPARARACRRRPGPGQPRTCPTGEHHRRRRYAHQPLEP